MVRLLAAFLAVSVSLEAGEPDWLSPCALVASPGGKVLYVACATGGRILRFDNTSRRISSSAILPQPPLGLALSADATQLYVACAGPESKVCIVDCASLKVAGAIAAGHTAMSPVLSADGQTLYTCNRFNNDVSVMNLIAKKEVRRIPVQREPVAAAITKDEKFLLVANHLHAGRADVDYVAAVVSVIDLVASMVVKEIRLLNGSSQLNDICVSPDGKYAAVTHILARFNRPTTQVYRGWLNVNALTLIDLNAMEVCRTVPLDDPYSGAANPWGAAWSPDGTRLLVSHAGTHEISVIEVSRVLGLPDSIPVALDPAQVGNPSSVPTSAGYSLEDLPFVTDMHQRVKLPSSDLGPRAIVVEGDVAYTANYFSDTLSRIDLGTRFSKPESIPLGPRREMSAVRKGEFHFHDASSMCYEGWQSCATCHPGGARSDGLNWDLLNDGFGNPKNTKSLVLAHKTPPAMSLGVRDTAEIAVRAGIEHILFTKQPKQVPMAIDEYLISLKPVPSPHLVKGKFSRAAKRGQTVFRNAGCAACHPPGLFTDLHRYDVGTRNHFDKQSDQFDTPTLVEIWRTAPYLHDGSAATVRDVLTTRNSQNRHGSTSNLSSQEIDDLCAYLLSL